MSVVAGRPTVVRNAAAATLSDLDRELRAVETERQASTAVAWLDEAFAALVEPYVPSRVGPRKQLVDEYRARIANGSNHRRPIADVLWLPGVVSLDLDGRNEYAQGPASDAARWPDPFTLWEVDEDDDFIDGETPGERRERRRREQRDRLLAQVPAPVRHVDLTGRSANFAIADDPLAWRPPPRVTEVRSGRRSDQVDPLADLRRVLEEGNDRDVMIEVRDDHATGGRVWRLTVDAGRTWRTLPRDQAQTAWRLLEVAAQRSNRARFPMPPPAPPPARLSWSFADVRPDPAMASIGAQLMAHTRAVAEAADLEEGLTRLRATVGPSLREFEVDYLRRRFLALRPESRRAVFVTLLEEYVAPGRRVNWSTIVDDILGSVPHRPGSRLDRIGPGDRHPPGPAYDRCEPVPPRIDFTYDGPGFVRVSVDDEVVAVAIDPARTDDEENAP